MNQAFRDDISGHHPITSDHIAFFRKNGYIKLKQVLQPRTLAYYGEEITRQVFTLNKLTKPMADRSTYEKAFLQVMNIWTHSDIVKEFAFGAKLARIAAELMCVGGVRMYHDQALYKEPAGGITPWHADQYYWPLSNNNACTVWIPLQATPLQMGPLAISAGSHLVKMGRDLEISDESEKRISKQLLDSGLPIDETPFDLGEISYHYGWTFHRAGPNTSTAPRNVMTIIYIEDGMRVAPPKNNNQQADLQTWMPGAAAGDLVDTELNPVIWRK